MTRAPTEAWRRPPACYRPRCAGAGWNSTLYVTGRGLTTSLMSYRDGGPRPILDEHHDIIGIEFETGQLISLAEGRYSLRVWRNGFWSETLTEGARGDVDE